MSAIAAEALTWVDTPFVWGQSQKGVGCDCRGLVAGVLRELGHDEGTGFYATLGGYRVDRPVPSALLLEGFSRLFDQVEEMEPGDILLLKHGGQPAHMAIFVGGDRAVHAYPASRGPRARVCSRELRILFHKHPLHSVWRPRCR